MRVLGDTSQRWPDAEVGPWEAEFFFDDGEDRRTLVGLEIRLADGAEIEELTRAVVHGMPWRRLVTEARRRRSEHDKVVMGFSGERRYTKTETRGRPRISREFLEAVLEVVQSAEEAGLPIQSAVMEKFGVSASAAKKYIGRARAEALGDTDAG